MKKYVVIGMIFLMLVNISLHAVSSETKSRYEITIGSDTYDMVIISPNFFSTSIQPFIEYKISRGVNTFLKSTEEIYDEYTGRDNIEQIKFFIKDAKESFGITYVLLIGDVNLLPMRKSILKLGIEIDDVITDLYYADIYNQNMSFSSWDSNGNNIFGEFFREGMYPKGDVIDLRPDVSVGRIPCSTSEQLDVVIGKIITYETETYGASWFKRILILGGDTFPNIGINEGEITTEIIAQHMQQHEFETVKLWTSLGNFRPLNINKEINNGLGFICYSGHGYEQGFGTSPPNVERRIQYLSPYLIGVKNNNKLPIIFFDACSTTKLDFNIEELQAWYPPLLAKILANLRNIEYNSNNLYPCFSWELLQKTNGGAVAIIGSTRVALGGVSEEGEVLGGAAFLNIEFFKTYQNGATVGHMFTNAITNFINNSKWPEPITPLEFTLLGDPSLKIGGYQ